MTITIIQKVIKIGSSRGVTLPARDLRALGIRDGDEIEVTVRKHSEAADDNQVLKTANSLLRRYKEDFSQLAKR
ncbi:AbrB/MazE/SpoVT family DNA-binding domain-containing protein [Candidatus Saccharibacteria bacterium oral taxon 488]|nr:AbrB/MazE/SpoVT family DNA-binding domain-containing protein [Candidatus Saccharibacteria bacterium oral taxon 488]